MNNSNIKDVKFEDAMDRLEYIVNILQENNLSLDESLKIFEEGVRLVRICQSKLNDAETKVSILLKDDKGDINEVPFPMVED